MKRVIAKTLSLDVLIVLMVGCAVGPDYVRPETETADSWSESIDSGLSTDPAKYGPWWTVFDRIRAEPGIKRLGPGIGGIGFGANIVGPDCASHH